VAVERARLPLQGTPDTEVLIEACDRLGLDETLPQLTGL
jgi:hypothetical protein